MNAFKVVVAAAGLCALSLVSLSATAAAVTFGALPGANSSSYTTYSESGFTVTKTSGSGCVAKIFGNPVPSVFGGLACDNSRLGVFSVTGSGLFEFDSIDLAANGGALSYIIDGLVGGVSVWTQSNSLAGPTGAFSTIAASNNTLVDQLQFTFRTAGSSFNFDNIVLTESQVPEPPSIALALFAIAAMAGVARRRLR